VLVMEVRVIRLVISRRNLWLGVNLGKIVAI
jgi:hypothetical protein